METSRLIKSLEKSLKLYGEIPPHEKTETEESRVYALFNKIKQTIELSENPKQIKTLEHFLKYIESHLNSRCLIIFKKIFPLPSLDEVSSTQTPDNISTQILQADTFNSKIARVTHAKLEKLIRILGFIGNPQGVCDGITKLSLENLIFDKVDIFYQNLENINLILEAIENQGELLHNITKYELKIICDQISPVLYPKIQNFLAKIDLNFNHRNYKNLLEHSKSFNFYIEEIDNLLGAYEEQELTTLIEELKNLSINAENLLGSPLAFKIIFDNHTLTTRYDTKNKNWFFINSNELWTTKTTELKEKIYSHSGSSLTLLLGVSIFTKKLDIALPSTIYNQLKKIHHLSNKTCNKKYNFISNNKISLLCIACLTKNVKIIKQLLVHKDIEVNQPNSNGITPLWLASGIDHLEIVRLLLAHKNIQVNQANSNRITPLWLACQNRHIDVVKELISHQDIEVNQAEYNGVTPLSIACQNGHVEVVKLLLSHKDIKINQGDSGGFTPLWAASENGHVEVVKLLLSRKDIEVNQANRGGFTTLHIACHKGNIEAVKLLLSHKDIKINQGDSGGFTPLWAASENGHVEVVKLLLSHKDIEVNQANRGGFTPLHIACHKGNIEAVKLLLSHKDIKINQGDSGGFTPLWAASENGHIEVVKLLLSHKDIQVNQPNSKGFTPLHIACRQGHTEIVKILLKNGAEVSISDNPKINPISTAKKRGHQEIVKILESYKDPEAPLKKKTKKP